MDNKDMLRVVVSVPIGTRKPEDIINALYSQLGRIIGSEVIYSHEEWNKEPPVS